MKIYAPVQVSRTYTQSLRANTSRVFPLLCPVREADWIEGWNPLLVLSDSGVAEADCVFITAGEPADAVWFISRHQPATGELEMIKITPGRTVCKLTIRLKDTGRHCTARITYKRISLSPEGDRAVAAFTEAHYREFMRTWEQRMNHYLETGEKLREPGAES